MIALERFKKKASERVAKVLEAKQKNNKQWNRNKYQIYIRGLIRGYEITKGVTLKDEVVKGLVTDIMIDSGVMAEVLV